MKLTGNDRDEIDSGMRRLVNWHSPDQYMLLVNELMQRVPGEVLFRQPRMKRLREAWVLSKFAQLHGSLRQVRLIDCDPPDCEIEDWSKVVEGLEIVEVLETGRRRGDEYRNDSFLTEEPVEIWRKRSEALVTTTHEVVSRKINKNKNPGWSLLIYLNIGGTYGLGREDNKASLSRALEDAVSCFGIVWVIWDGELLRF